MKTWKAAAIAAGLAALFGTGLWWMGRPRSPKPAPPKSAQTAPQSPAHERAFLDEQLKVKPGHAPVLLRLAELDAQEGKKDQARKRLEEALAADPASVDALLELSRLCYELGDRDASQRYAAAILKIDPSNVDALYNLGAIHANAGRFADARRYWTQAQASAPSSESGRRAAQALTQIK